MTLEAGKLRRRVTIQTPTDSQGSTYGEATLTWSTFATRWASVEPTSGSESSVADQMQGSVTHRVRMRYLSGVTTKMRILYGSRVLNIESVVDPDERRRELELLCTEEVD